MYSQETLKKVTGNLKERINHYMGINPEDIALCISKGNRKIGKTMNVSLPPIFTCPNCAECSKLCYDIKACLQYPNTVIDARARNLAILKQDRKLYFDTIEAAISRRRTNKAFRWHVAGDIIDVDYFDNMVRIARNHPDFTFWTYTKNYHAVNEWLAANGGAAALPTNFTVMFSEWRGMPMINPFGMPEFRVVFHDDAVKPDPKTCHYCPGNCDICLKARRGCVAGETTYCHEH